MIQHTRARRAAAITLSALLAGLGAIWLLPDPSRFSGERSVPQPPESQRPAGAAIGQEHPDRFFQYHHDIRAALDGTYEYPVGYRMQEFERARAAAKHHDYLLNATERGPGNIGGRTRALLADPDDPEDTWWAGSVGGGLWKTTDGGDSWNPVAEHLPNLAVGCLAMADSNRDILYMGTGEGFGNLDYVAGNGIFKSEDRGASWTHLTATAENTNFRTVNRCIVDPADPDVVVVATNAGIFRSSDGGASWTGVYTGGNTDVQDLRAQPGNFDRQIAGVYGDGVVVSSDAGVTWSAASMPGSGGNGRFEVAYSPSRPAIAYAAADGGNSSNLFRSSDGGATWAEAVQDGSSVHWLEYQGWYDNTLAVHPFRPDTVFVGGVFLWRVRVQNTSATVRKPGSLIPGGTESWLEFVDFGGSAFSGRGVYLDPSAVDVTIADYSNIEIRFGQGTQMAHRFWVSATDGSDSNGGAGVPYSRYNYGSYTEVPFQVWDRDNRRQLMVSFRDQADDGAFNLIEYYDSTEPGTRDSHSREYIFIHKYDYNANSPHARIGRDGGVVQGLLYFLWPVLVDGATWDPSGLASQTVVLEFLNSSAPTIVVDNGFDPNTQTHVDHHNIVPIPIDAASESFMVINANDGGVAVSSDGGASFRERDHAGSGYNTAQFYGVAKRPGTDQYIGGMQDNGTWVSGVSPGSAQAWSWALGGDGFEAVWHAKNDRMVLGTIQHNYIWRSVDGGSNWHLSMDYDEGSGQFLTTIAGSDKAPDSVYTTKADGVWYSRDFGGTWSSTPISNGWGWWSAGKIRVSIADPEVVWTGYGMGGGRLLHVSRDAGISFSAAALPSFGFAALISGLATHPELAGTAYALFSRYSQPKVLETTDYGQTWRDLSGFVGASGNVSTNGFPNVAVQDLVVMPGGSGQIWAGTDIGLFESTDAGDTWSYAPNGLPAVSIYRMKLRDGEIVVATHGRGIWTIPSPVSSCEVFPPAVTHDPLAPIDDPLQTVSIVLEATAFCDDTIETARVHYGFDGDVRTALDLAPAGTDQYAADLPPIPQNARTLAYYLEVESELGLTTLLPTGAPAATYDVPIHCAPKPPEAFHEVPAAVDAGQPLALAVDVLPACQVPVSTVVLWYSFDGAAFDDLELARTGGPGYSGELAVPQAALSLSYYFEATADDGLTALLPAGAPGQTFTVAVTRDQAGPSIVHMPFTHVATSDWPPEIAAEVSDASAISRAWVSFEHEKADGTREPGVEFDLTPADSLYNGTFPAVSVGIGDRIHYRLWASDSSFAQNVTALPPDSVSAFRMDIIRKGVLAAYDFEGGAAFDSTGIWRRTTPGYGLTRAHSGAQAWVTNTDAPYPSEAGLNLLEVPSINLSRFQDAWLEFWYWHDFEHQGISEPLGSPAGKALDGGTVRVSVDDGASWQVLPMESGYTAHMPSDVGNPLAGDSVFAGYSFGWRRALAVLPQAASVLLRFEMGTGAGNSAATAHGYAGWAIDDVRVLEARPQDGEPPAFVTLPAPTSSVLPGSSPRIAVEVSDSTGVADVLVDYTMTLDSGTQSAGQVRLAMDTGSLTSFADSLPLVLAQGDYVEYRLTARDFDGNEVAAPAEMSEVFTISANLSEADMLANATLSGLWEISAAGGYAATGSGTDDVSSISLQPYTLPFRALNVTLDIAHTYEFPGTAGGNLKASIDGGNSWSIVAPSDGYQGTFSGGAGHVMDGEAVFAGSSGAGSTFDLSSFAGRTVRLRIDLGTSGGLGANESWEVAEGRLVYVTSAGQFEPAGELELHSNYPDPFRNRTTISYTLSEPLSVRIEVFNVLGQRVRMMHQGEQAPARYTVDLDMTGLAGGVYLLRLHAGRWQQVESLILMQ